MAEADELWARAEAAVRDACGWQLVALERLGRRHDDRAVWLAERADERVVVKLRADSFAAERAAWTAATLAWLRGRGYPAPEILWSGAVDEIWFVLVETFLPGRPLGALDGPTLDALVALTDLQQGGDRPPGGWDVSWWVRAVVFEGWWQGAAEAAPEVTDRLREFIGPAWGHHLPVSDVVHHDFGIDNILGGAGVICGVVDWDHFGYGSRAVDLAALLFDWQRLALTDEATAAPDGHERLTGRALELVGEAGFRSCLVYGAIARLALSARRGQHRELRTCERVVATLLDRAG